MKDKELYDKTISILVKAYLNDTLEHTNCYACAVGNIIASNMGFKVIKDRVKLNMGYGREAIWDNDFPFKKLAVRFLRGGCIVKDVEGININHPDVAIQIASTGYTALELALIESAFEEMSTIASPKKFMYQGLIRVVEVLGQIHEVEKEVTEETKLMFVK